MKKILCNRCGADVTNKVSSVVNGIRHPYAGGNGVVTEHADVCARCYREVWKFLNVALRLPRRRRG